MARKRLDWRRMTKIARKNRILSIIARPSNRAITGTDIAQRYFRNITRGGVIVFCWREKIKLPNARRNRRRSARIRASGR